MKKISGIALLLILALSLPLAAKDKEQDGTLLSMDTFKPVYGSDDDVICSQARVTNQMRTFKLGQHAVDGYLFSVKLGDFVYEGCVEKKLLSKVKKEDWPANTPVKVRFDVKGGFVASRTKMTLKKDGGKEMDTFVVHILDSNHTNYCGARKCDPDSALKKQKKEAEKSDGAKGK